MENFDAGIAKNNNEIIFFNKSNKKAFSFDINSEKIKEITFNTSDDTEITDIAEYSDRFYILDKKRNLTW